MQRVMQNNAAVFRTGETLKEGVHLIDDIFKMSMDLKTVDRSLIWFVSILGSESILSNNPFFQKEHRPG